MNVEPFSHSWLALMGSILTNGDEVSPRGKVTMELPQQTIVVPMSQPVLAVPKRQINYRFMAAEAYWILTGDDRVETIAPWNKHISNFSDDGVKFFGAYGPKVMDQLPYVVDTLRKDLTSRQAGLTIWREKPQATKDVPCTVAIFFGVRNGGVNVHVFMRSNDVWLGTPYDVFNFSMLGHLVCGLLNRRLGESLIPDYLHLTAASSHLYETNWESARECLDKGEYLHFNEVPDNLYQDPEALLETLRLLRDTKPGDDLRWWEP